MKSHIDCKPHHMGRIARRYGLAMEDNPFAEGHVHAHKQWLEGFMEVDSTVQAEVLESGVPVHWNSITEDGANT